MRKTICFAIAAGALANGPVAAKDQEPVSAIAGTVYENVCHLETQRSSGGSRLGSAVLYRGRYLLTAGHNVMQDWSSIRSIRVNCGAAEAPEGGAAQQVLEPWQASDSRHFDALHFFAKKHDFGVIRLSQPIATTQAVTLAAAGPATGDEVCLAGYPSADEDQRTGPRAAMDGRRLHAACAPISGPAFFSRGIAYPAIPTFHANSGGPVLRRAAGGWELVAIHIQPSSGRVVDRSFKDEVERLIDKLDRRARERGVE